MKNAVRTSIIRKHGNSQRTTIPPEIMKYVGWNEDDVLIWFPTGNGVHVSRLEVTGDKK